MISVHDVAVSSGEITLLPPTSLDLRRGGVLAIRGRNGTGKSTLLRVIAGILTPTKGAAAVDGRPASERDPRFRTLVAAMIGLPPMAPDLTVSEHILLVARTWIEDAREASELSAGVIRELGLSALAARFPSELSSGQTQLFGIALVLARPFQVLLLDEPEQRLDPEHVDSVIAAVKARNAQGVTVVVATHSNVVVHGLGADTL